MKKENEMNNCQIELRILSVNRVIENSNSDSELSNSNCSLNMLLHTFDQILNVWFAGIAHFDNSSYVNVVFVQLILP